MQEDPEDIERTTENGDYEDEENSDDNSTTCIAPDITHFPNPLIKKEARQRGAVIIHILLAIYMFLGNFLNNVLGRGRSHKFKLSIARTDGGL